METLRTKAFSKSGELVYDSGSLATEGNRHEVGDDAPTFGPEAFPFHPRGGFTVMWRNGRCQGPMAMPWGKVPTLPPWIKPWHEWEPGPEPD